MKTHLINMHLLLPRSRSSAKIMVKYKGYISQKMAVSGAFVFHKHILFFFNFDAIFIEFDIVVCKPFEFGSVKNLSFGKWSMLYQATKFLAYPN